ncbi:MAG: ammonium transporter [Lentisphaeraceae bacterium]|nr:ammonium transporter [Lentisphaeraceae bacterium]
MKKTLTILIIFQTLIVQADDGFIYAEVSKLDYAFILTCASMVFLMQMGFMCLESGLCHSKNSINVAVKNLTDFMVSMATFWIIGFGLMFGRDIASFIGCSDFASDFPDTKMAAFFLFQAMFCGTASTINSGAISGRAKFSTYIIMTFVISGFIYPIFGHWAWGGLWDNVNSGWLEKLGFLDFAGSSVVHSVGGWIALAAIIVIGPRKDKFDENGKARKIAPSSLLLFYIGVFVIAFGWFGFNAGSLFRAEERVIPIMVNTLLAACFGGLTAMGINWWKESSKTPQPEYIANGLLAGFVSITASCAWVSPASAVLIGIVAGAIFTYSVKFIEDKLKLDDVVGSVSVHGVCGVWGTLAVCLFMKDEYLTVSRFQQCYIQFIGIVVCFAWSFGTSWLVFKFLHESYSLRVSFADEEKGLNLSEHNIVEDGKKL